MLLPLTLIASTFGMNVLFPGEGTHTAFWIIVGVMIAALATMIFWFRRRGFF
jgi:LPXTG-motif cell wall-anchored protein